MNILRRILYVTAAALVLTEAAVIFFPDMNFVQYVTLSMKIGFTGTLVLAGIAFYLEDVLEEQEKRLMMNVFIGLIMVPTLLAAGAFLHDTQTSWSNGEIHYHADYEVLVEENGDLIRTDLVNPSEFCENTEHESSYMCSINDRTGSVKYHEHNDQRIHLEGTFKTKEDASLAAFFQTFGGKLSNDKLVYPTTEGVINKTENGKTVKILVEKGVGKSRHWCVVGSDVKKENICRSHGKLADSPKDYIVSAHTQNPRQGVILDNIFIVYDSQTPKEALQDLRNDNRYRGMGLKKGGEGYDG